ncbi:MAG: nucleoporin [Bacteroidaceae bacterium]|nr:nucleoporin [Bacteroidaceae bacterium]
MKNCFKEYEEFYISDDPQEIERERKKRESLLSTFPVLTGGGNDRTKYVISNGSSAEKGSAQQLLEMQQVTGQDKPGSKNDVTGYTLPSNQTAGNTFGQPGRRNTGNAFGQPGNQTAGNAFGQPGRRNTGNAFGQPSQDADRHRASFIDGNQARETATPPTPGTPSTREVNNGKEKNKTSSKLRDILSIVMGGYTPHRPIRIGKTPWGTELYSEGPLGALMNYIEMKDIDKWEKGNEKNNRKTRETLNSMKKWPISGKIVNVYEKFLNFKEAREAGIPSKSLTHTLAAVDIGLGIDNKSNNLASTSDRFAKEIDKHFVINNKTGGKKHFTSTLRNALRHAIWQGVLSSQYSPQVAYDVAMSHETMPYADTEKRIFDTEAEADMVTDLLNNVIGRKIGAGNRYSNRKQIALLTLEELWKNGLYHYEPCDDGKWRIAKVRISDDVYNTMRREFSDFDDNGR